MLIGEYKNNLGNKHRVAVPKRFREQLDSQLIITRGYEGCLILVSLGQWDNLTQEVASGPFVSISVRDTTRFLLGGAHEIELDKQGRFVIPANLIDFADIDRDHGEVVFLGLGRWIEIWDSKKWDKRREYLAQSSGRIAEKLSEVKL